MTPRVTRTDMNPVLRTDGRFHDPLCVCGKCFAPILAELSAATDRLRPAETSMRGRMVAAKARTERETNVSHNRKIVCDEAGVHPRKFQGYLSAEWSTVSLRDADALLCAFGRADVVRSLTVLVRQGGQFRLPLDRHACELLDPYEFSSACRLAAVESTQAGATPVSGAFAASQTAAEAA